MSDRLPLPELQAIDIEAARKRLDKAIAARNAAEREVHEARWAWEKVTANVSVSSVLGSHSKDRSSSPSSTQQA